jgi:hypothetical protein
MLVRYLGRVTFACSSTLIQILNTFDQGHRHTHAVLHEESAIFCWRRHEELRKNKRWKFWQSRLGYFGKEGQIKFNSKINADYESDRKTIED